MTRTSRWQLGFLPPLALLFLWLGRAGGSSNPIDVAVVTTLAAWRHASPALTQIVIAVTWLGSAVTTLGGSVLVAAWLIWKRHRRTALLLAGTVFGERLLADGIKLLYDRVRPAIDLHPVVTSSSSYPSGHAANSMTAFVVVALLAVPARNRVLAITIAVSLAACVGLSRPFLGVHWPSDMVGGWLLAAMVIIVLTQVAPRVLAADEAQHQIVSGHRDPAVEN